MGLHRRGESGNVFFTLFGAIALIGVIGVATSTLMRGPVGTVMNLNQRAKADSQLQIARKLVALNAVNTAGDCETPGDGYVEPAPPDTASPGCAGLLTGGGCIPTTVGAARTDPWGTLVGYCGWNHGPSTAGNGCSAALLAGDSNAATAPSKTVIAVISAGPDRQFQSTCGADPAYVTKGGDDIVDEWTMSEAQTLGGGGLWTLVSGNPGAITTSKDVDISNNSTFASGTTATFQGNAAFNAGSQLSLANGALFNLPTQATLPDSACQGAAATANDGVLRINTATGRVVQICDPTSLAAVKWVNVGGAGAGLKLDDMIDAVSDFATGGNLFLGNGAGGAMVSGSAAQNVAVGIGAGSLLTTGQNNVLLGFNAGDTITTENGNILIGDGTDIVAGQSNRLDIGNLIYGDMGAGRIGIGTSTPGAVLDINGTLNASGNGSIGGALNVGGGATVSGAATVGSTLDVTGAATLGSTLSVTGNVSSPGGTVNVASGLTTTGPVNFGGTMAVAGASTINNTLHVTGAGTMDADLAVLGNETVAGDLAGGSLRLGPITSGIGLFSDGASGLQLQTNALKRLQITSGGAVGIGVASPSTLLDVGGGVRIGLEAAACGPTLYGTLRYTVATDTIEACSNTNAWVTVGTSGGGGGGTGGYWLAGLPGGSGAIQYGLGNVGVGTLTPLAPLHVTGNFVDAGSYTGVAAVPVSGAGTRMFFDVASGSFRAGSVTGTQWDSANTGNRSLSFGLDTVASGVGSLSMGYYTLASGDNSMALGSYVLAGNGAPGVNGNNSLALGLTGVNTPNRATVTGNGSFGIFMQDQHSKTLAASNTMGLFGGRLVIDPNSQATLMAPNPNTDLNVNGNIGSVNFCDVNGNNCFTAADVTGGTTGAPGGDRQIVYNSGGTLAADAGLVYTASGRVGVGPAAPATRLDVGGTLKIADGGELCAAGVAGGIRYNGGRLEYCDGTAWQLLASSGAGGVTAAGSNSQVQFNSAGILAANANFVWDNTNGRLGIGTVAPGMQLDVNGSAQIFDQTPVTGVTGLLLQSGAGQSNGKLLDMRRAAGGTTGSIYVYSGLSPNFLELILSSDNLNGMALTTYGPQISANAKVAFTSGPISADATGAIDTSLARNAPGVLEINNGTSGQYRDIQLRAINPVSGKVGVGTTSPATLLDVAGTLRIADGGEACAAGTAGGLRYSGTSLQYCDGTAWNTLSIASGNPPWNTISNPTGNQALTMAGYTSTFTYNATTGAANLFNLTDTAGNTGTGYMLNLTTGAGSTLKPFHVSVNNGTEALMVDANGRVGIGTAAPGELLSLSGGNLLAAGTFGSSPALGASGAGTRMMWYPRKAALRAGQIDGTCITGVGCWDDASIGTNSTALGFNTMASGANGTAVGTYANALGTGSSAFGSAIVSMGLFSTALGVDAIASGDYSMVLGLSNTGTTNLPTVSGASSLGIFMQDQHSKVLAANNTMGLFGGRFVIDPAAQATLLAPNPNTDLNVNGNIGAVNYCDVNGNNCFTTANVAAAVPGAPVNSIQYNAAGAFGGSVNLIWDNTNGRLGVGAAVPATRLEVGGTLRVADGGEACAAGTAGGIRYSGGSLQYCNGAAWTTLSTASGTGTWDGIISPVGNQALTMGAFTSTWTWNAATGASNLFNLTDTAANTGTGYLLNVTTKAGSALKPFHVSVNNGAEALMVDSNGRVGIGTNAPGTQLTLSDGATQSLAIDSISNPMRINAGAANLNMQVNSNNMMILNSQGAIFPSPAGAAVSITPGAVAAGAPVALNLTGAAHTGLTASTETPDVYFNLARNEQWAAGALAMQRAVKIAAPTYRFAGASALTDAATVGIMGAPVQSTNAAITNTYGLLISSGAVSTATNSYGLTVNAQTGAGTNYAATFLGGRVGIGTATPPYRFSVVADEGNVNGENVQFGFGRSVGAFSGIVGGYVANGTVDNGAFLRANNSVPIYIGTSATHQALTILDNGKIGIGAPVPATVLDVNGTLRIADGGEACAAGTVGGIRYNGGAVQFCDGAAWANISGSATVNLGTLATATNPQRSAQANTGFYTPAVNQVAVSANGTQTMLWDTTAAGVNYFTVASGATGAAPTLGNAGTDTNGAGLGLRLLGKAATAGGAGGGITLTGGAGNTAGAGGAIGGTAGQGGATGAGGAVNLAGGAGGATSGTGGALSFAGGAGTAGNSAGGAIGITTGAGQGSASAGALTLAVGASGATGNGVAASLAAGNSGTGTDKAGGNLTLQSGSSTGAQSSYVIFNSAIRSGSGVTANATQEAARIGGGGLSLSALGTGEALMYNAYVNGVTGNDTYLLSASAFEWWHDNTLGVMKLGTAPSGTAGNTITFSYTSLYADTAGNVGIGAAAGAGAAFDLTRAATASGAAAYGARHQQTLTASANNDILYGLYMNTTYNDAARTGVVHADIGFDGTGARLIRMGANGAAGAGNILTISGGAGGTTSGNAGAIALTGGTPVSGAGGAASLTGSAAVGGNNTGGAANVTAGNATGNSTGGSVAVTAGRGGATGTAGAVTLTGGAGGTTSGNAGGVTIIGGTPVAGAGGSVNVTASAGVGTNQNGGAVTVTAGAATGSGTAGYINLTGGNVGVRNAAPGALLDVGTAGATLGTMRLEGNTSGYVQVQPTAAAGSWTITLPSGPPGVNGYVLSSTTAGVTSWVAGGGVASPGGSDKQVQFNDGGSMAGNANLTFDKTTTTLTVPIVNATTKITLGLTAGANAPATTTPVASVSTQIFTANGTYTAPGNLLYAVVEVVGGGGGGGGVNASGGGAGAGGGGGGYAREVLTAATIGASQAVTVGTGGTAGANTGTAGGGGNPSQFGAGPLLSATGGSGGQGSTAANTKRAGGAGGAGAGGDINISGTAGEACGCSNNAANANSGGGGSSYLGGGAVARAGVTGAGIAGGNYGGGGSGGAGATANAGGAGAPGVVVVTEYKY